MYITEVNITAPPNLKRLEKLAKHLETGKLGHKKFDFSTMNSTPAYSEWFGITDYTTEPYKCGTNGCAIGECPIIFKSAWKFDSDGMPNLRGVDNEGHYPETSAQIFFSLTVAECDHLFMPERQSCVEFGGKCLLERATKKQVARNIRIFIEKYKSNPWR